MSIVQAVTADQLFMFPADGLRRELIHGEMRTMSPASAFHGKIANLIAHYLTAFVLEHDSGTVFAAESGFWLDRDPDHVRAPDVSFVKKGRPIPEQSFFPGSPDLAIEVTSPSDTYDEVLKKVQDWLDYGTARVVVVDPRTRTAMVYDADQSVARLTIGQSLTGGDVVPGWELPLSKIFA